MASIGEHWESRPQTDADKGDKSSASKVYIIETTIGSETEADAIALLKSTASATYLSMDRKDCKITPLGAGLFRGEATYDSKDQQKAGEDTFSFDIADLTEKRFYSISTKNTYRSDGGTHVDFKGGINVTLHGVEGVDLGAQGAFMFEVTKTIANTDVTGSFISTLIDARGCINNDDWAPVIKGITFAFLEGEVRFVGARGSFKLDPSTFELTLKFACQRSVVFGGAVLVVGGITVTTKRGWDYLWVSYGGGVNAQTLIQEAKQVNVEEVFEGRDFDTVFA